MAGSILLENNYGYHWYSRDDISVRGYVLHDGQPFRDGELVSLLSGVESFEAFKAFLDSSDGCFSILIRRKGRIYAAVDRARSMPIYFTNDGSLISDSLKAIAEERGLGRNDLDPSAMEELLKSAYLCHERTVYKCCSQLNEGQLAEFSEGHIRREYYYVHKAPVREISRQEALDLFEKTSEEAFSELLSVIGERPIVISLSGGYDSRYVACMLKKMGAKDVSCYSYGLDDSFEIAEARHIAQVLGYRWKSVEYTNKLVRDCFDRDKVAYYDIITGMDSDAYMQNYAAVKLLHEEGWFKPGSVFITGLCNDMPTGYYLNDAQTAADFTPDVESVAEHVVQKRNFHRWLGERSLSDYRALVRRTAEEMGLSVTDYQSYVSACDAVVTVTEHSRLNLHMNDVHAFFGYEWLIPCWSRKLLDFWYSMPVSLRVNQNLYEEFIISRVPAQYGLGTKKQVIAYTLYSGLDRFKARLRLLTKRLVCMPLGLPLREEDDFNNFNMFIAILYRRISQKKLLGFRNLSVDLVFILYMMEQWFGRDFYNTLIKEYNESGHRADQN